MNRNIILAGVGGQGLLALAAVIGEAARALGLDVKQAEVHGMAQRGGVVQSHLRYAERPLHSNLVRVGTADLILALEPMEALRYLPYLSPIGAVVSDTSPLMNIPNYPKEEDILGGIRKLAIHRLVDAGALAKEAGAMQAGNMAMLGAGAPFLELPDEALIAGIEAVFSGKAASVIETNLRAFRLGLAAVRTN
jgi:indolepyruvate ferredoxin oxidoreductase beta subunit